jgi:hypothetical protein
MMDAFALDSMITRSRQAAQAGVLDPVRLAMIRLFANQAHARSFESARRVLTTAGKADAIAKLQPLQVFNSHSYGELVETVAAAVEARGGYPFPIA